MENFRVPEGGPANGPHSYQDPHSAMQTVVLSVLGRIDVTWSRHC